MSISESWRNYNLLTEIDLFLSLEHKVALSYNPKHSSLRQDSLVNCGNGSYQYSCKWCQGIGEPASWCSNDCEWNNFWQECREKGENTYVFFNLELNYINYE